MLRIANEVSLHTGHFREIPREMCKSRIYFHFRGTQCTSTYLNVRTLRTLRYVKILWYSFLLRCTLPFFKRTVFPVYDFWNNKLKWMNPSISRSTPARPYSQVALTSFSFLPFFPEIRILPEIASSSCNH